MRAIVILIFIMLCGCNALPRAKRSVDPGSQLVASHDRRGSTAQIDAFALQSRVMGMADDYGSEISEIVYLLLKPVATTAEERALLQSYVRNSFGAAAEIASGPNPESSLLDLLVLVSLQRATFQRHWIPEIWGKERGGPALARLQKLEDNLWSRSDILLSTKQKATLRGLIDTWLRDNPDRLIVSLVRFEEFAGARHLSRLEDRKAASGLLKEVGEAVGAIDEARLLAERTLWYTGRLVYILGEQMELTTYRILSNPDIENALADVQGFRETFERAVDTFEFLPELLRIQQVELMQNISAEREATVNHIFDRLNQERKDFLSVLETESERLHRLLSDLRETIVASTDLMRATGDSAAAIDGIVARFARNPTVTENEEKDTTDTGELLAKTTEAVDRMTILLDRAGELLKSPELNERIAAIDRLASRIINRILFGIALIITFVFAGTYLLRTIPRR